MGESECWLSLLYNPFIGIQTFHYPLLVNYTVSFAPGFDVLPYRAPGIMNNWYCKCEASLVNQINKMQSKDNWMFWKEYQLTNLIIRQKIQPRFMPSAKQNIPKYFEYDTPYFINSSRILFPCGCVSNHS